jgi:hypothetical protein
MTALAAAIVLLLGLQRVDPAAMTLLSHMSATLSSARSLVVSTRVEREQVDRFGRIRNVYIRQQAAVQRPNLLYIATAGDVQPYGTWYDGVVLSVYEPAKQRFARTVLSEDDDAVLRKLSDRYDLSAPIAPFLASNPYRVLRREIETARIVGRAYADDEPCTLLAFTGKHIDWQLWVTADDTRLPARMAAIFKHRPGKPRLVIEFVRWDLDLPLARPMFEFRPPPGAQAATFAL